MPSMYYDRRNNSANGKTKKQVFYIGKLCGTYEIEKLLVFHITYFQGWSAVCSCYISLGISGKEH